MQSSPWLCTSFPGTSGARTLCPPNASFYAYFVIFHLLGFPVFLSSPLIEQHVIPPEQAFRVSRLILRLILHLTRCKIEGAVAVLWPARVANDSEGMSRNAH